MAGNLHELIELRLKQLRSFSGHELNLQRIDLAKRIVREHVPRDVPLDEQLSHAIHATGKLRSAIEEKLASSKFSEGREYSDMKREAADYSAIEKEFQHLAQRLTRVPIS